MCLAIDASHVIDNPAEHRFLQRGEKAMQPAEQGPKKQLSRC